MDETGKNHSASKATYASLIWQWRWLDSSLVQVGTSLHELALMEEGEKAEARKCKR